jgi:hypothetical protein
MSDGELERWTETWKQAGAELERIRREELRRMTDDDVRRAVADLFSGAPPSDHEPRTTSGLVEQQRLFAKLRPSS